MSNGEKILACARQYVGLSEVKPNMAWDDLSTRILDASAQKLVNKLKKVGWQPSWAYCMAFVEAVLDEAYENDPQVLVKIRRLLNPSVMNSYQNVSDAGLLEKTPEPGAIFFMQKGGTGFGHAGFVEKIVGGSLVTLEANTSPTAADVAKDREGDGIYDGKVRPFNFNPSKGLWIRGFLNPLHSS
jgi:hypothetical protein